MSGSLPIAPIRALLVQGCPNQVHISDEAIVALRGNLEDIIHQIGHESLREFEKLNSNRERHGLRAMKRLNSWSIERAVQKIINGETISYIGSQSAMIGNLGDIVHKHENVTKPKTTPYHKLVGVD